MKRQFLSVDTPVAPLHPVASKSLLDIAREHGAMSKTAFLRSKDEEYTEMRRAALKELDELFESEVAFSSLAFEDALLALRTFHGKYKFAIPADVWQCHMKPQTTVHVTARLRKIQSYLMGRSDVNPATTTSPVPVPTASPVATAPASLGTIGEVTGFKMPTKKGKKAKK